MWDDAQVSERWATQGDGFFFFLEMVLLTSLFNQLENLKIRMVKSSIDTQ